MVTKERLVQMTEASTANLMGRFTKTPYFFYTENDLHTFLFHEIFSRLPIEEWECVTKDGKSSILLHKEYPTKERYSARNLLEDVEKGSRGHFDLSIWNPELASNRLFRVDSSFNFKDEQQTFIVVEFDLIEGSRTLESALHHFKWDLLKLRGKTNEVEHGYQLVFVRAWAHQKDLVAQARTEAAKANNVTVLYIETNGTVGQFGTLSRKSFLNYKPAFK